MDALESARAALQQNLDALNPGATLELTPSEYPGPFYVRRPVTVDGKGATMWARQGPLLYIEQPGVVLKNLRIEVTGDDPGSPEQECAILVRPGADARLEQVEVRGRVIGLNGEDGLWRYPNSLYLGPLAYGGEHVRTVRIFVPVPCRGLVDEVSGIHVEPHKLTAGPHELRLTVEKLPKDTLLWGRVLLSTASLKRWFMLSAHITDAPDALATQCTGIIWEPEDWSNLLAGKLPQMSTVPLAAAPTVSFPASVVMPPEFVPPPVVVSAPTVPPPSGTVSPPVPSIPAPAIAPSASPAPPPQPPQPPQPVPPIPSFPMQPSNAPPVFPVPNTSTPSTAPSRRRVSGIPNPSLFGQQSPPNIPASALTESAQLSASSQPPPVPSFPPSASAPIGAASPPTDIPPPPKKPAKQLLGPLFQNVNRNPPQSETKQ